jgi:hypothetical protein
MKMPQFDSKITEEAQSELSRLLERCNELGLSSGEVCAWIADAALKRASVGDVELPVCSAIWSAAKDAVQGIAALKSSFELIDKEREYDREQEMAAFSKAEKDLSAKIDLSERNLALIKKTAEELAQAENGFT